MALWQKWPGCLAGSSAWTLLRPLLAWRGSDRSRPGRHTSSSPAPLHSQLRTGNLEPVTATASVRFPYYSILPALSQTRICSRRTWRRGKRRKTHIPHESHTTKTQSRWRQFQIWSPLFLPCWDIHKPPHHFHYGNFGCLEASKVLKTGLSLSHNFPKIIGRKKG